MRSERISPDRLASDGESMLAGGVLLAPVRLGDRTIPKGTRLDDLTVRELRSAASAGSLKGALRIGWAAAGDVHEDDAALRLASAVAGPGIRIGVPSQSRVDLSTSVDGIFRVKVEALGQLNRIDPLEVFTLFHSQAVRAGQVVGSVKVAPHLVAGDRVEAGECVARDHAPLLAVDPYRALGVAAIAAEALAPGGFERFDQAARTKVMSLGGRFLGTTSIPEPDPDRAAAALEEALRRSESRAP
jgi:molybdenum cofactor cytidylyltransferase